MRYLDASALVKLYFDEPGSEAVGVATANRTDLIVSDLSITECVSALARRVRESTAPAEAAANLYHMLLEHLEAGRFDRFELAPAAYREAERLMLSGLPLRAGDALHLAAAVLAGAEAIMTFDRQLGAAAKILGLEVVP